MKRLIALSFLAYSIFAQQPSPPPAAHLRYGSALPSTCKYTTGDVFFRTSPGTVAVFFCSATNTWTAFESGAASGTVTSVGLVGTANQITVTGASPITGAGSWTLSFPTNVTLPGTTTGTFSGNLTGNASGTAATITGLIVEANTPLTTKGDLLVEDGTTLHRLGVGSDGQVLTADAASADGLKWTTVAGTGDVVGPGSATDNAIARFDGTTGKLIQNSAVTIADTTGTITTPGVFVSTIATGTAPLTVSSTTVVANLNASTLSGATFAAPGTIGAGTPAGALFTTLFANTSATIGNLTAGRVTFAGTAGLLSDDADLTFSGSTTTATNLTVSTMLTVGSAAAPTINAVGQIAQDNNLWASGRGAILTYDGTASTALVGVLVSDTPTNGQTLKWNTGGTITWEDAAGAGVTSLSTLTGAVTMDTCFGTSGSEIIFVPGCLTTLPTLAGPNAFTAGGTNTWTASATDWGARLGAAANPSNRLAGGFGINLTGGLTTDDGTNVRNYPHFLGSGATSATLSAGIVHVAAGTGYAATSSAVVSADLNITTTTCTNQFLTAISATATGTCSTVTLAGAQFANQGTTTTVLHGNGAGNPSFGAIVAADITTATITAAKMAATTWDAQTDAATITWAIASVLNAQATVTLGGNRTLNISNPVIGGNYVFRITQDGTGTRTLTKGTGCTWKELGSSAATFGLSTAVGAIDVLTFTYDGTNCLASVGKAYGG